MRQRGVPAAAGRPHSKGLELKTVSMRRGCSEAQGLHHCIMERGAELLNLLILARGMHAIGEQYDKKLAVRVDPDAGAGKTGVAEAVR